MSGTSIGTSGSNRIVGYVHIADGGAPQIVVKSVRLSAVMELWQASNASSETGAPIVDGWRTRDLRADDQHLRHTQGARGIRGDRLYDSATLWKSMDIAPAP